MTFSELGITARNIHIKSDDNEIMPHLLDGGGGGAAADELVQSTLDDFEPTIAGKTHSEIFAMSKQQRWYWYKKLTAEEKTEALRIVDTSLRAKRSVNTKKRWETPESRAKISEGLKRYWEDSENRAKRTTMMSSEFNPMKKPEVRVKRSGENHPAKRPEVRARMSKRSKKQWEDPEFRNSRSGENSPNWQNGRSFLPYCPKFNDELKESIRNRDGRTCVLCGKGEILNGRKLSVHHIDSDKMQGCRGKNWYLCALCISCNSRPDTVEKEFLIVSNLSPISGRSGL